MPKRDLKVALTVGHGYTLQAHTSLSAAEITENLTIGDVIFATIQGDKRSMSKNALSHVWYSQIEREKVWSAGEAKRYCKLRLGVPILSENPEFSDRYNRLIKHKFSYEEKIDMMDFLPITSLMTEDQMGRYLTEVQQHWAQEGVILSTPKDSEYELWKESAA